MNNFEIIKDSVTVPQAARFYGILPNHINMCRCPFHADNTPSMKLYEKNYHCFGCGAHGDVIGLAAQLFGTSQLEAAKRINADFGLGLEMDKPLSKPQITMYHRRKQEEQAYADWEKNAWLTLAEYYRLLCQWHDKYAPASDTDIPDPRFIESLKEREYAEYLCDIFINGSKEERTALRKEVTRIEHRMQEYRRSCITCVAGGHGATGRTAVLQ